MSSLLSPFVTDKVNAKYSSVRLDLNLQAEFLWKLQFCVSVDSNALAKWKLSLPDCVHVIERSFYLDFLTPFFLALLGQRAAG